MSKIAVLGPAYSYSHLVGKKVFSEQELLLCNSIEEIFIAVTEKKVAKGIIPIENMLQGSVRESILGLLKYKVKIHEAYIVPIRHCVAGKSKQYTKIISHPQALGQCSNFLAGKNIVETSSTSKAMETAAQDESFAAIGSKEAAEHYGLQILQENIEDNHDNVTQFFVISAEEKKISGQTRTSLLLKPKEDRPGLLFHLLAPLASQNINLVKIESLPSGKKMGEYVFYIEIDAHVQEERVKSALEFLRNSVEVYSLGSYEVKMLTK
ncbi:MAG: prephenate dehydratase [Nanoarchaeota archaeon]|nr:prephenate dehydratase [Nanoarchaeota archaeon]